MYLKRPTTKSTGSYWDSIKRLGEELETADAILIGAGGTVNLGGFYPYVSLEEYWAWWSRHIYFNQYDIAPGRIPFGR